ncbi:transmembrane protein 251 [Nematolebias whitei]|uniref:transmembrane protein 251 n=1 Tax=Nematolebias whitei TaxID=451745 RepID=UPI0018994133|nr:transmembrane protein 251 [Nematolebias whitei]
MMNFRQRMGWVGVALFLLLSIVAAFCVFEVVSLERVQRDGVDSLALPPAVLAHLPPLPLWMWASVFLVPYLQLFLFLFSCTRADPHAVGYCVLPVCIVLLWSRCHTKPTNQRAGLLIHM